MQCNCAIKTDIVLVNNIPYKPFFFDFHMYFVNLNSGELFKTTPIFLGASEAADLSKLKSYFKDHNIEIIDGESILKKSINRRDKN